MSSITSKILLSSIVIFFMGCASGTAILTGTKRTPTNPEQIKLYVKPPKHYQVIGIVKASSDMGLTEQMSLDYAVKELKNQAAKLGANGVLLTSTGKQTSTAVGGYGTNYFYAIPTSEESVTGQAIYVKKK